jgi:glycerophosphoryl diester phosphodiesterase
MKRIELLPAFKRPLLFAHRGASSLEPENTMASFKKAREVGSPGIELDVHLSKDGRLVVAHDEGFKRTAPEETVSKGRFIEEMQWEEIKQIDLGKGEHTPLMADVLEEFCSVQNGKMYIDIELKSESIKDKALPLALADLLGKMKLDTNDCLSVSSFNPIVLRRFKAACPNVPTAVIWCIDPEVPKILWHGLGLPIADCDYAKPFFKELMI